MTSYHFNNLPIDLFNNLPIDLLIKALIVSNKKPLRLEDRTITSTSTYDGHHSSNALFQYCTSNNVSNFDNLLTKFQQDWLLIQNQRSMQQRDFAYLEVDDNYIEHLEVNWLINLFNTLFTSKNVQLIRGGHEPEYFPSCHGEPARIEFAHGYFQSALHEISHWSIAGNHRRTLPDFGYWYSPDGRTASQQKAFEKVEVKPQAIECLFTLVCGKTFRVSQDNLHANFDTSHSTFAADVYTQANRFINQPHLLPEDAKILLTALAYLCHDIDTA